MGDIIKLYSYIAKLKKEKRTGWTKFLDDVESVADHSFGVSFITLILAQKLNYDVEKCLKLALVHDFAESITKDITPEQMSRIDKINYEKESILKIADDTKFHFLSDLGHEEFDKISKESILVSDADRIEMCLQALYYEKENNVDLSEFFEYARNKLKLDYSKNLLKKIIEQRKI